MDPTRDEIDDTIRLAEEAARPYRFANITYPVGFGISVIAGVLLLLFPVYSKTPDIGMIWWLGVAFLLVGAAGLALVVLGQYSKSGRNHRRKLKRLNTRIDSTNKPSAN